MPTHSRGSLGLTMILIACSLLAIATLNDDLGSIDGDNAQYIFLAQALATGQGYRTINEPGSPPETYFPPLFPLMLAPIIGRWGIHAYWAMHLVVIGWAIGCLALWLAWAHRRFDERGLTWSLALFGTAPLWIVYANRILTEIPFLGWSLAAMLAAERYARQEQALTAAGIGTALALGVAYFTRTVGVVLTAVTIGWLTRRAWRLGARRLAVGRAALLLAIVGGAALAWHLRNQLVTLGQPPPLDYWKLLPLRDPYQPHVGMIGWSTLGDRMADNLRYYLKVVGTHLVHQLRHVPQPWVYGVAALPVGLVTIGFARRLRRGPTLAEWYLLGYGLLIWLWPFQEPRFLVPVLPWLFGYLVDGINALAQRTSGDAGQRSSGLMTTILLVILGSNLLGVAQGFAADRAGRRHGEVAREWLTAHEWLAAHAPADAVLMSRKPTITALLTDRRAIGTPWTPDPSEVMATIDRWGVTHLIVETSEESARYLRPAIARYRDRFEPDILRFGRTSIVTVRRRNAPRP